MEQQMKTALTKSQQTLLRGKGILTQNEVAYQEGDLYVAEDVLSGARRILANASNVLSEATSTQVLYG